MVVQLPIAANPKPHRELAVPSCMSSRRTTCCSWQLVGMYAVPWVGTVQMLPKIDKYCIKYWQLLTKTDLFHEGMSKQKQKRLRQTWNAANMGWGLPKHIRMTWILINIDSYTILVLNGALYGNYIALLLYMQTLQPYLISRGRAINFAFLFGCGQGRGHLLWTACEAGLLQSGCLEWMQKECNIAHNKCPGKDSNTIGQ